MLRSVALSTKADNTPDTPPPPLSASEAPVPPPASILSPLPPQLYSQSQLLNADEMAGAQAASARIDDAGVHRMWEQGGNRLKDATSCFQQTSTSADGSLPHDRRRDYFSFAASTAATKIDAVCGDYVSVHRWSSGVRHMHAQMSKLSVGLDNRRVQSGLANVDRVYRSSHELVDRLHAPPYELPLECTLPKEEGARTALLALTNAPPIVNPLLLVHERVRLAMHFLLLVGRRAEPWNMLLPELWVLICGQVLCMKVNGKRVPLFRRFGFTAEGSLRVVLDPPISLLRADEFHQSMGSVLTAATGNPDPQQAAATAAAMLGEQQLERTRGSSARVHALMDAFSLPLPEHMFGASRVGLRLSVDGTGAVGCGLYVREPGWVQWRYISM